MPSSRPSSVLTANELLARAQNGDEQALEELSDRIVPSMIEWATGRLPNEFRDMCDTSDIVMEVMIKTMRNLQKFEPERDGSLGAYLRMALRNRILDEIKTSKRRRRNLNDMSLREPVLGGPTPLDHVMRADLNTRYENALDRLKPSDREIILARLEFDSDYEDVARATGRPTAHAARVAVSRALSNLAAELARDER